MTGLFQVCRTMSGMGTLPAMHDSNCHRKEILFFGVGRSAAAAGSLGFAWGLILALCGPILAAPAPVAHGVIFFCPPRPDEAVAELQKIRDDGFNLVEFASWPWTLPKPGSSLETIATAVLDWCDVHEMRFFLMHNI